MKEVTKEELISILKWCRDEYVSPAGFSSIGIQSAEESARKLLLTMVIDFLEKGENKGIAIKYRKTFVDVCQRAIDTFIKHYKSPTNNEQP